VQGAFRVIGEGRVCGVVWGGGEGGGVCMYEGVGWGSPRYTLGLTVSGDSLPRRREYCHHPPPLGRHLIG